MQKLSMMRLIFLVLIVINYSFSKIIEVNPSNGQDSENCLKNDSIPCATLDYVFQMRTLINLNNTKIILSDSTHVLKESYMFHYLWNFKLLSSENAVINCTQKNAGLMFRFSRNINILGITITNCGVEHISTSTHIKEEDFTGPFNVTEAIRFECCRNIQIENSSFIRNHGVAVAFYDTNGANVISNVVFKQNTNEHLIERFNKLFVSGGGIYLEFTFCGILDPIYCTHKDLLKPYNSGSDYKIINNTFYHNYAESREKRIKSEDAFTKAHMSFGKGGGVAVSLLGSANKNSISILDCLFIGNKAHWGGGYFVSLRHVAAANRFLVERNNFQENYATYGGGGIRIHSMVDDYKNVTAEGNDINFQKLEFVNNSAIWGGGMSISGTTRMLYTIKDSSRNIKIENCTFYKNRATVGFAVGLATWNINPEITGPGMSYRVSFIDSVFERNEFMFTEDKKVIGQGALYSDEVTLCFAGSNIFIGNNHTAVVLETSVINFERQSYTLFDKNSGTEGGAIAMYGNSWLMFGRQSSVTFKNNIAINKGGAIYMKFGGPPRVAFDTTQLQTSLCFFRYMDKNVTDFNHWDINVFFINNTAPAATGNSIYASTLQFCRSSGESRESSSAFRWHFIKYTKAGNGQAEVVTNAINININKSQWKVSPSLPFSPNIAMLDERNQSVYGSVKIDILSDDVKLDPPNNIFLVRSKFEKLRLLGKTNSNFKFRFLTTSGQIIRTNDYKSQLASCKPGFRPKDNLRCECMATEYSDVAECTEDGRVYILKGKWGYERHDNKLLDTEACPKHYCKCNDERDSLLCLFDLHNQCVHNRKGQLCSECVAGTSVVLGAETCKKCSNYYLLLLVPIFLAISLFVMFIMYFNFDAFSGYLNSYLYTYQMVMFLIPEHIKLDRFISLVIGITGLSGTGGNFGICLYDGMTNLEKEMIIYIFPGYMLLFTIVIGRVIPQKIWSRLFYHQPSAELEETDIRRRSFGCALSFVLVICYSAFTQVTIGLLHSVKINGKYYMYQAAYVEMFHGKHIGAGVLAILVMIFIVVLFPIVLLFTPFFTSRFSLILRIQPVFDTLKDCFKERAFYRMFAGFYFLCRLILLVLNVAIQEQITRLIVLSMCCVVFQAIFTAVQPYKRLSYNLWDILLLTNMSVISLLSLILSVPFITAEEDHRIYKSMLHALVYLPFITVVLRLVNYLYLRYFKEQAMQCSPGRREGHVSGRIRRWMNKSKRKMQIPERVVEDFESDYVEFQ